MSPWSISIKTVGGQETDRNDSFTVTVSPDDELASLQDQIESETGLKASQQRLIFRGRLLGGKGANEEVERNPRIRDVAGLADGQTIHLVPKPENSASTDAEGSARTSSEDNEGPSLSGTGTASLLAALLGLGSTSDDDDNVGSDEPLSQRRGQRQRLRTSRSSRNPRSVNHRLTSEDIIPPDPGSMEPVRQGLLTLHTMLRPASEEAGETESNDFQPTPLDANRQWYRGQWVDCLDTVNQWLEATIVDIVPAQDILPPRERTGRRQRSGGEPPADLAVHATDYDGRRRLLLEPCDEDDSDEEQGELAGFRQRDNNEGVQLLLVHYNGWPHRWDEWLRSDSQRLRPFRTRTRHPTSAPHASPTPQSVFHAAPTTYIRHEDDDESERSALLPELSCAVAAVNVILASAAAASGATGRAAPSSNSTASSSRLPWMTAERGEGSATAASDNCSISANPSGNHSASTSRPQLDRAQLESLAPLLDRLGRTLTDAAPHVAALAQNLPDERSSAYESNNDRSNSDTREETSRNQTTRTSTGSGLFSLLSLGDSMRRGSSNSPNASTPLLSARNSTESETGNNSPDPDHVDFVNGMVNTDRGDSRGSRRSQSDDGASLLGAYLAAASLSSLASGGGGGESNENNEDNGSTLGQILRSTGGGGSGGGGGGGGIDVHIHAIITGPGVGPGAVGLAMMGGDTPPIDRVLTSGGGTSNVGVTPSATQSPRAVASDHDDMGLFSDLYSENPEPVTLQESAGNDEAAESADSDSPAGDTGNLATAEPTVNPGTDTSTPSEDSRRQLPSTPQPSDHSEARGSSSSRRSNSRRGSSFRRVLSRAMGRR